MLESTQTIPIEQRFASAVENHRAGQMREAEAIYRQILSERPDHPDALHLLGVIENQFGRRDQALQLLARAAAVAPASAEIQQNFGIMLAAARRNQDALVPLAAAVRLEPRNAKYHYELGNVLLVVNRVDDAIGQYRAALTLNPRFADAHQNLGCALHRRGKLEEAESHLRQAIAIRPDMADAFNNLGGVLTARMQLQDALTAYQEAIRLRPNFAAAMANSGSTLRMMGKTKDAIDVLQRAIQLSPNMPEAFNNLGIALKEDGRLDEAIAVYRKCLALRPSMGDATNNLGNAYKDGGNLREAIAHYGRSLVIGFANPGVHSNLIYTLQFHPGYDDEALFREQRRWNDIYAEPLKHLIRKHDNDRSPDRKLRIGYVSPYFYHQAESFFVVPLLENHDRENFDIHCYASVIRPDQMTHKMQAMPQVWHDVLGMQDGPLAEKIRADKIDILIDLAMHMAYNRLVTFALKPAPVQVAWLAYPGGTGLDTIDFRITDAHMDPQDKTDLFYREQSYRLPDCWCCYNPLSQSPPAAARPQGPIRFGSINNPCKNNEEVLSLWAKVIKNVPGSQLLTQSFSDTDRNRIRAVFQSQGIGPDRIEFVPRKLRNDYLRLYDSIDICLDPFPYNGITTTCDALWMGVPVVTLIGKTAAGRAGASILSTVGLTDLIANSPGEFIEIATKLAADAPRRANLRATLRQTTERSPLMDAVGFTRKMEAAYRHMWRQWCRNQT